MKMKTPRQTPRSKPPPGPDPLSALKRRLVRDWTARHGLGPPGRLTRLAAIEAEALAWQTPVPLLVLPALLEEKLERVRGYEARQRRTLPAAPVAGHDAD